MILVFYNTHNYLWKKEHPNIFNDVDQVKNLFGNKIVYPKDENESQFQTLQRVYEGFDSREEILFVPKYACCKDWAEVYTKAHKFIKENKHSFTLFAYRDIKGAASVPSVKKNAFFEKRIKNFNYFTEASVFRMSTLLDELEENTGTFYYQFIKKQLRQDLIGEMKFNSFLSLLDTFECELLSSLLLNCHEYWHINRLLLNTYDLSSWKEVNIHGNKCYAIISNGSPLFLDANITFYFDNMSQDEIKYSNNETFDKPEVAKLPKNVFVLNLGEKFL